MNVTDPHVASLLGMTEYGLSFLLSVILLENLVSLENLLE